MKLVKTFGFTSGCSSLVSNFILVKEGLNYGHSTISKVKEKMIELALFSPKLIHNTSMATALEFL